MTAPRPTSRHSARAAVARRRAAVLDRLPATAVLRDAALDRLPATVVVVVGAWVLIAYSVGQWRSLTVPSWDLAIFAELVKAYAHGQAPIVPIKGDHFNLLGDHFHPLLVVLAPVWRLFPSALTLLVVQDLLLAVSAWPLTRLATRLVGRWTALGLGFAYVFSWGIQGAVQAQFHEIALAVPMLAWGSVAFVERRWRACALWLAPLVLVKEDMGLTLLMAGLAIVVTAWQEGRRDVVGEEATASAEPRPDRPPRTGLLGLLDRVWAAEQRVSPMEIGMRLAVFGLVSFAMTVAIILPLLSDTGQWQYGLDGNAGDGMPAVTSTSSLLSRLYLPHVKVVMMFILVCAAGFIGLCSPWMTLVLPTLAWRLLSAKEAYWQWEYWHYNAVLVPIALGALLDVVARLRRHRSRKAEAEEPPVLDASAPSGMRRVAAWLGAPVWARRVAAVGLAIPMVTGAFTASDLPLWQMTQKGYGGTSSRAGAVQQVIDTIPEGATVETDLTLLAYLVPRATVSWVGTSAGAKDYVVVDTRSASWGGRAPTDAAQWATDARGARYRLVLDVDGFQVAQRVD